MRLTFDRFPRNLPGLVSCMAFALTAVAGIEARGAIAVDTDPNSNQALARNLSSGIIVDWNREIHVLSTAGLEDQERTELPYLSPEDLDCAEAAQSSEDTRANNVNNSADLPETNAADDGDYMEYKYGHYGHYFGSDSRTPKKADDANQYDFSTPADDPNNLENSVDLNEKKNDDDSANVAESKNLPNDDDTAATKDPDNETINNGSDLDSGATPGYEKYYRYRYMPLGEQVGRNEGSADDDADNSSNPKEGVESEDEGDDSQMTDDESSSDEMADDDESDASGEFTDAMVAIASQMADDWTGQYGMRFSDIGRLMGWNN
jgi:hypothetical protein